MVTPVLVLCASHLGLPGSPPGPCSGEARAGRGPHLAGGQPAEQDEYGHVVREGLRHPTHCVLRAGLRLDGDDAEVLAVAEPQHEIFSTACSLYGPSKGDRLT